jgi:hypothetical protein
MQLTITNLKRGIDRRAKPLNCVMAGFARRDEAEPVTTQAGRSASP